MTWQHAVFFGGVFLFQLGQAKFFRWVGYRVGLRKGHHDGWCKGYEMGGRDTIRIMARLSAASSKDELLAARDEMLAELEPKH